MKSNQLTQHSAPITPDEAARMTALWPDLLHSQIQTGEQAKTIADGVKRLTTPATKQWISGRVATLLSQYFASSVPTEMIAAIAEDWHEELKAYPSWALQNACRWWMGEGNDKRRQKPLAGDIAERARIEMGVVRVAQSALRRFDKPINSQQSEPERPEPTAEQKARVAAIAAEFTQGRRA